MDEVKEFVARVHALANRSGLKPSTLSRKLLGNGTRLGELEAGKSLRVDTLAKARADLSAMEEAA